MLGALTGTGWMPEFAMKKYARWLLLIFVAALLVFAVVEFAPRKPDTQPTAGKVAQESADPALFPQLRSIPGYTLTIYAPQVRSWPSFERFTSTIAFALTPTGQSSPHYGTATVTGDTVVD